MSTKFTIETATDEQWLDVLDYIFETEPSKLKYLAEEACYDEFLSDNEIYYALEAGGVDNWNGYDEAIDMADADDNDWSSLSNSEKLDYLSAAGVDNWGYYGESLQESLDELFTTTKPSELNAKIGDDIVVAVAQDAVLFSDNFKDYFIKKCEEYQNKN